MTKPSNPKRTGGPRTSEGRSVASRNALKTGAYSYTVVLSGESLAEFESLQETLLIELRASGVLESALVQEIAAITWKKLRLQGLESRCLNELLSRPESPEEFYEFGFPISTGSDWALTHLDLLTPQYLASCRERIKVAIKPSSELEAGWATKLKREEPELYEKYMAFNQAYLADKNSQKHLTLRFISPDKEFMGRMESQELDKTLGWIVDEYNEVHSQNDRGCIFVAERLEEALRIRPLIRDRRLSKFLEVSLFQRGHEDLNRVLSKVLKEFRQQQGWRRSMEVIEAVRDDV